MNGQHRHLPLMDNGCGCGPQHHQPAATLAARDAAASHLQRYLVTGMTREHCVRSVTEEITKIEGMRGVRISLDPGATSEVNVTTDRPVPAGTIAAAITAAGYQLTQETTR